MSTRPATDDLIFATDDGEEEIREEAGNLWKVIIVDDEEEVHNVTRLALDNFSFGGAGLEFLSAHSGKEAMTLIAGHPDTALILLDVVMETDHAGLDVVKHVREELNNTTTRIVLRTGQPGQAPEQHVITEYDINDYKDKTELTATKLFTLMYSSLRSYRDIMAIEANKRGLEKIIDASSDIFELKSMNQFANGVLEQISSLLYLPGGAVYCRGGDAFAATRIEDTLDVVAATGVFEQFIGSNAWDVVPEKVAAQLNTALKEHRNVHVDGHYAAYFKSKTGAENLLFLGTDQPLTDIQRNLIEIFCRNVSIAFENIYLKEDIDETQREIVYRLGEAVETRSLETGYHVKRIAEYSHLFALAIGLDEEEAEILRLASPLHDIGKVGIPDAVLNKPGKFTPEEWEIMQTHAAVGYEMFKTSKQDILRAGAIIAHEHHEKWDGTGYPRGLKGEDIHIYGRIVAVADVFDALGSDRCYKKAWELDRILDLLKEQRGKHFDPKLVDIFFSRLPEFLAIRDRLVDPEAIPVAAE